MKELTVVPYAGLCNRLNSIVCAIDFHEQHPDVKLKILWFKYHHCNCRFKDIFKPLSDNFPQVNELHGLKNRPGTKTNFYIPDLLRPLWFDCSISPSQNADLFEKYTEGKSKVFVYKDNRFCICRDRRHLADIFKPKEDIQNRIDKITSNWGERVVGLHIRRTDNKQAISQSPIEHFYEAIECELKLNPSTCFYLATDDDIVKDTLKNKYGSKIISAELTLNRWSCKGMKDAVVDLYCLASAEKIYGSSSSTYSLFASKLFDSELIIL